MKKIGNVAIEKARALATGLVVRYLRLTLVSLIFYRITIQTLSSDQVCIKLAPYALESLILQIIVLDLQLLQCFHIRQRHTEFLWRSVYFL